MNAEARDQSRSFSAAEVEQAEGCRLLFETRRGELLDSDGRPPPRLSLIASRLRAFLGLSPYESQSPVVYIAAEPRT